MLVLRKILLFLVLTCAAFVSQGQGLPAPMSPARLVNDFAGILTSEQQEALETKLAAFDRETSTQITLVTVADLQGYAPSDFAQKLHDKWGVGSQGKNNGILVLVKPKTPDSNGETFISVGYGLEGVVPDITAGRIIDVEMLPSFRENDMYTGIDKATDVLMQLTRGEFTAEAYTKKTGMPIGFSSFFFGVLIFLILFFVSKRGKGGNGGNDGNRGGGWIPPIILGGGRGGGIGGFGGGGGFGGFGGGMSGGGGGGRSW